MNKINIGIIGLGLIGSSLAQALHQYSNKYNILGFTSNKQTQAKAPFNCYLDYKNVSNCDVIFICSPLSKIIEVIKNIKPFITNKNTIVTDVGSIKAFIEKEAQEILQDTCIFIGGHPMAGTEFSGYDAGDSILFQNKTWILLQENKLLQEIIQNTQANIIIADSESHDKAAAMISHLPLLLSCKLLNTLESLQQEDPQLYKLSKQMASSGFASMTRLAKGNQTLNHDLLTLNKSNISDLYKLFIETDS